MDKLGFLDRVLLGRGFSIAINLVILAIVVPITFEELVQCYAVNLKSD